MRYELVIKFKYGWTKEGFPPKWITPTPPISEGFKTKKEADAFFESVKDNTIDEAYLFDNVSGKIVSDYI